MESANYKTLPSWTYSNETFFEPEKRELFLNSWQLICHSSSIPLAGDYFTFDLFNERLVAVRDEGMELRVSHNVCSHRATKLFDCVSGNCGKRIVCPYHAWSYDLSGNLKYVPGCDDSEDLDLKNHGLRVFEHEIFQGSVFCKSSFEWCPSGFRAVQTLLGGDWAVLLRGFRASGSGDLENKKSELETNCW